MYKVIKDGKIVESRVPGKYAGHGPRKIFGRLDCWSGKDKMHKKNRVFFLTLEDAIRAGYRPCKVCRPLLEEDFEKIKYLIPQCETLEDFYKRDKK